MKIRRKVTTAILTAVMLLSPVMEISASSLSDAQKEKENLEKQLEEAQSVIDGLKDSKDDIQTKVKELDQQLTGISTADLRERGLPKTRICRDIAQMIQGNTLLLAYNAHFDLSFLFYLLLRDGDPAILKGKDKLDLLTVYKDRRPYPHKLCSAIDAYCLSGKVVNSHRAVDDVIATVAVMEEMEKEKDDLMCYVNLFGYNPKYGIDGKPIGSVTYKAQPYDPVAPLYEL